MNDFSSRNGVHRSTILGLAGLAIVAMAGSGIAWFLAPERFFASYLTAILLPWSISVGSLTLMLIFYLTGGKWARGAWPWLALNARLIPLVALLFVPWLFGIERLYPWAHSDILTKFENTANRQWFYQIPFFVGRTIFYFAVWSALAWLSVGFTPSSSRREPDDPERPRNLGGQPVAGLGLVAILLTVTWAGIDWVMSFDPFFKSTLFGALIGMGGMMAAMSAAVAAVCFWPRLNDAATDEKTIGDLASLLLAFLMLWAYFSFAHFLIMWTGDLRIEASFYAVRNQGIWEWISPILAVGGFVLPFLCLLSYDLKRTPKKVGALAVFLLVVRLVELSWMVLPGAGDGASASVHWATVPATVAVVAIYLLALAWLIRRERFAHQEVLGG